MITSSQNVILILSPLNLPAVGLFENAERKKRTGVNNKTFHWLNSIYLLQFPGVVHAGSTWTLE